MRHLFSCAALCVAVSLFIPTTAAAGPLQPAGINLGLTSFFDGFGRNDEGFTYLAYAQYAMAREIARDDGTNVPYFNDPKIDAFVLVNQLVYVLPEKLFGDTAHFGFDFIVPAVAFNTSFHPPPPAPGFALKDNGIGLGDITFGPLLQFKPIIAGGRPIFSQRFEVDVIAPTGKYSPYKDINQGSGFTSINPYWAGTLLFLPHAELSVRLHYLYNFKMDRPPLARLYTLSIVPDVEYAQPGQAGWINFAASYEVLKDFHIGVNGYYFLQFNQDLYQYRNGTSTPGLELNDTGKVSFLGIGPGLFWSVDEKNKLFANVYFQTIVRNWPKNKSFGLRWIHGF